MNYLKRPKAFLAIALVAFLAEEIWSLSSLGGQTISSTGGPGTSLLLVLLFSVGLLVLCSFLVRNVSTFSDGRNANRGLLIALAIAAHLYSSQELLQLLAGYGHAVGLHGLVDHGAWIFVAILVLSTTTITGLVVGFRAFREQRHLTLDLPLTPPDGSTTFGRAFAFSSPASGHFDLWGARGPPSHA